MRPEQVRYGAGSCGWLGPIKLHKAKQDLREVGMGNADIWDGELHHEKLQVCEESNNKSSQPNFMV